MKKTNLGEDVSRGFTLVELLIVIAILAVLSVTVVLVLNPAELLRQSRDSTRLSDLDSINRSIALFLTDVATTTWAATTTCTAATGTLDSPNGTACQLNTATAIDGSGWVRGINFGAITGGSPLARLPIDPVNVASTTACAGTVDGCYYVYRSSASFGRYKLFANMESTKFAPQGTNAKDGGNVNDWYETGTDLSL
jgi:prepilin-type N-terminal cleavage/methylation domain-containing protein